MIDNWTFTRYSNHTLAENSIIFSIHWNQYHCRHILVALKSTGCSSFLVTGTKIEMQFERLHCRVWSFSDLPSKGKKHNFRSTPISHTANDIARKKKNMHLLKQAYGLLYSLYPVVFCVDFGGSSMLKHKYLKTQCV